MKFQFIRSYSELSQVLALPELAHQVITDINCVDLFDDNGNHQGTRIDITVTGERVPQQVIQPMVTERLEAAELMIDLLLDTQQETPVNG